MAKKNYFGTKLTPKDVAMALGKFGKVLEEDLVDVEREVCEYGAEQAWKQLKENTDTQNGITIEARRTGEGGYYLKSVGSYQLVAKGPEVHNKWHGVGGKKPATFHSYKYPLVKLLEYGTGINGTSANGYVANKGGRGVDGWHYYDSANGKWVYTRGMAPIFFMRRGGQMMRIYLPSCAKKVFNANKVKREMGL